MSILTLTVSPAIDKSTTIDKLVPEQKMRCATPRYDAGGGGINVSKAIRKLGGSSLAILTAGGPSGQMLKDILTKQQIDFEAVETEQWTRENFIVTDTSTNAQYRFGLPGAALTESEKQAFLATISKHKPNYVVASSSLPPLMEVGFYEKVAAATKKIGARLILDTSGEPLKAACDEGVYLLKPSIDELSALVGVENLEMDDVDDAARTLIGKGKCEVVVVSLGPKGALLVTADICEYVPAPTIHKKSTVGAGDSMVAGMTWALVQKKSYSEMVRWGVACGSAATMNEGTELFKKEDVLKLYDWIVRLKA